MADQEMKDKAPEFRPDRSEILDKTPEMSQVEGNDSYLEVSNDGTEKQNCNTHSVLPWNCKCEKINTWVQRFVGYGYWDWPPSKWGKGGNEEMAKKGKSPMEIWEVHTNDIVKNHERLKKYHENILTEYETAKKEDQTILFWKKYWKSEFQSDLPNPEEMEERWKVWNHNGYSKETFWDEERKKFDKDNGWNFWKKRKAECQEERREAGHGKRCMKMFHLKKHLEGTSNDERPIFKAFDF